MSSTCLKHIENYWKLKTKNANKLFNEGNYKNALKDYKDALYRAEVLTKNTEACKGVKIPFIQVYIISSNNLANTYKELGEINEASKTLKKSVLYLIHLAKNNLPHVEEIKLELRKIVTHYFNFANTYKNILENTEEKKLMLLLKEKFLSA